MEIIKITDESFSSIEPYLNMLAKCVNSFQDLSYVQTDKGIYMICPLDKVREDDELVSFAVVKNDGRELKDYCFSLDQDGNLYKVVMDNHLIVFDDKAGITYRKSLLDHTSEQLQYSEHENGVNVLYYIQRNPVERTDSMHQYIVNAQGHTLETYLPYLTRKKPDIVNIGVYKSFLSLLPFVGNKLYIKAQDGSYVRGIKVPRTNGYFGLGYRGKDLEDILDGTGIRLHVSDAMADIYRDRNKEIGDIEEVAKVYKKDLLSKK